MIYFLIDSYNDNTKQWLNVYMGEEYSVFCVFIMVYFWF